MKILTIGTGQSTQRIVKANLNLKEDIITFALHRAVPYLLLNSNLKVDYWTWFDPDAAMEGLRYYDSCNNKNFPTVIIPDWLVEVGDMKNNIGGTPFFHNKKNIELYKKVLNKLDKDNKLIILDKVISTKRFTDKNRVFLNPNLRFKDNIYFGTDIGLNENKFTMVILPICHFYFNATEVYTLGFDNKGKSIGSTTSFPSSKTAPHLSKLKTWRDWEDLHGMKLFSCAEDKFTPNNTILPYVPIETLCQ